MRAYDDVESENVIHGCNVLDERTYSITSYFSCQFGRIVDLEKLETVTVNRNIEELKEQVRRQESKNAREASKGQVKRPQLFRNVNNIAQLPTHASYRLRNKGTAYLRVNNTY